MLQSKIILVLLVNPSVMDWLGKGQLGASGEDARLRILAAASFPRGGSAIAKEWKRSRPLPKWEAGGF